jgi:pyruvate/2-oxoglutarate dehydrogenase complex dihydrolipoamide acyltransferase (E2) component
VNLKLVRQRQVSSFRKVALGTWRTAYDPSVYGSIELRMEQALAYLAAFREATGRRATVTHLVGKACAMAMRDTPEANATLRFGRVYLRQDVGVFFQVAVSEADGAIDLSGLVIQDMDQKSLLTICDEFAQKVELVRTRRDPDLERTKRSTALIPGFLVFWALRLMAFIIYTLNLPAWLLGLPKNPFGSVMVSNVGSLGLDVAYPPLVHYARVPLLLAIGRVSEAAVVEGGVLAVGQVMRVSVTFDHRFIDGVHAANMAKTLRAWIEDPFHHFDALTPKPHPTPAETTPSAETEST